LNLQAISANLHGEISGLVVQRQLQALSPRSGLRRNSADNASTRIPVPCSSITYT
jgi:hypothetical protein